MKALPNDVLLDLIGGSAEPLIVARVDRPDWPVAFCNQAFRELASGAPRDGKPFADVIERLLGRELAVEISETVRAGQKTTIPVELKSREFLLSLTPLGDEGPGGAGRYIAAYWRVATPGARGGEAERALVQANRRIRDLSRDDPVTGLQNAEAFNEILEHDWAVAAREQTTLTLVAFGFDDFQAYVDVFGQHASDSSLRRVAQVIRRSLRRASDVAARVGGSDGGHIVVLSHGSDEASTRTFAASIGAAVRELGLHHPRSRVSKFVTVSFEIAVASPSDRELSAAECLQRLISGEERRRAEACAHLSAVPDQDPGSKTDSSVSGGGSSTRVSLVSKPNFG